MKQRPTITRTDIYVTTAGLAIGLFLAMFTGQWDWLITGALASVTLVVVDHLRRMGTDWTVRAAVVALTIGLLLWLWLGDGRWAVLGLFPLVFVVIRTLASTVEGRR